EKGIFIANIYCFQKKAQRIKPNLYDGSLISNQHPVIPVIDDEEILILEEVSRSKMLTKQNDPISKEKKINTTLINYVELNRLSEDFGKRFVPQQELSTERAFRLQTLHPNTDQYDISPIKIEAHKIIPDAITYGEYGFEHTYGVFLNEIIPFLKTLKDIFNVFDKDLLNEEKGQSRLEVILDLDGVLLPFLQQVVPELSLFEMALHQLTSRCLPHSLYPDNTV
nr:hypothetical protein [Tanacetum cinerariifolium]